MSWLGTAGQELDEPQQQALLRIVAAANQNAGADDSEEEDEREVRWSIKHSLFAAAAATWLTSGSILVATVCGRPR